MRTLDDMEALITRAIETQLAEGFTLIAGDWGVFWEATQQIWMWDEERCPIRACDALGAVLLDQPQIDPAAHRGDPARASLCLVDEKFYANTPSPDLEVLLESVGYRWSRNIRNGWDGLEYLGDGEPAYILGKKLASIYSPIQSELIVPASEVRLRAADFDSLPTMVA